MVGIADAWYACPEQSRRDTEESRWRHGDRARREEGRKVRRKEGGGAVPASGVRRAGAGDLPYKQNQFAESCRLEVSSLKRTKAGGESSESSRFAKKRLAASLRTRLCRVKQSQFPSDGIGGRCLLDSRLYKRWGLVHLNKQDACVKSLGVQKSVIKCYCIWIYVNFCLDRRFPGFIL